MKITMLLLYFEPEITADANLRTDLCYDLASYGADVTVITGMPYRGIDEKTRIEYINRPNENLAPNLKVKRVGLKAKEKSHFLIRALRYLFQTYIIYRQAKKEKTDVFFIASSPPFLGIAGALLSKKAPSVYNLQDIFPDSLINTGKLKEKSIPIRVLRKMERFIYENNTHLVTISEDMKKTLLFRDVPEDKISVVYNWADISKMRSIKRENNILFSRFNLSPDRFYVSYAGNIGLLQNLQTIIDGAELLLVSHPDIHFVIIGDGAWKEDMLRLIKKKELKNISVFPLQSASEVDHVYSLGNIEIVSISRNVSKSAFPSKTWNIMAAARPVLCEVDKDSELYSIIEKNQCGICIEPSNTNEFVRAVIQLYENNEQAQTMGLNGRRYAEQHLSRQNATRQYFDCLKKVYENYTGE
jgi:glycosyltransferase involved in cell wall biosynthesis